MSEQAGPCDGYPHFFIHNYKKRIGAIEIVCVFCGKHAVPFTPEQIAEIADTVYPYRCKDIPALIRAREKARKGV